MFVLETPRCFRFPIFARSVPRSFEKKRREKTRRKTREASIKEFLAKFRSLSQRKGAQTLELQAPEAAEVRGAGCEGSPLQCARGLSCGVTGEHVFVCLFVCLLASFRVCVLFVVRCSLRSRLFVSCGFPLDHLMQHRSPRSELHSSRASPHRKELSQ